MQITAQRTDVTSASLEEYFAHALNELLHGASLCGSRIAIALSGGADSMAAAMLSHAWAKTNNAHIITLTVDHGLRPESATEAAQVAAWMKNLSIPNYTLTPPLHAHENNPQANARQRRYDALAEWCHNHDILHCILAHHAGDQMETSALMHARGKTEDGEAGMSAARSYCGVRFIRPLLDVKKHHLTDYLTTRNLPWVEDPSNQNPNFARVRVRTSIALNDGLRTTLSHQQHTAALARAERDTMLAKQAVRLVTLHPLGFAYLAFSAWETLAAPLDSQLLADLLTTISGNAHRPRAADTHRLCAQLREGATRATLHGCDLRRSNDTLRIARELARCEGPVILRGRGICRWDSRFQVHYNVPEDSPLTLRALGKNTHGGMALPPATAALWDLDKLLCVPYMDTVPDYVRVTLGFAPLKPLARSPFWWLKKESRIADDHAYDS